MISIAYASVTLAATLPPFSPPDIIYSPTPVAGFVTIYPVPLQSPIVTSWDGTVTSIPLLTAFIMDCLVASSVFSFSISSDRFSFDSKRISIFSSDAFARMEMVDTLSSPVISSHTVLSYRELIIPVDRKYSLATSLSPSKLNTL